MSRKIERTAYHEAGHAVASYHLHVAFSYISITPDEDSWGHVKHPKLSNFKPEWDDSPIVADRIERMILTSLAGQVAEGKFANRHNWRGSGEDWQSVINLASYSAGDDEVLSAYVNYLWARAKALFNRPYLWAAVEAVAEELLIRKKMGSQMTRKIIRKAIDDHYKGGTRPKLSV